MLVIEQSQGVCAGSLCGFAPQMEPFTSNKYGFSPSPSTASPLPLPLKINTFSGFREWSCAAFNRFLQPSLIVAFNLFSELSSFSELWVLE